MNLTVSKLGNATAFSNVISKDKESYFSIHLRVLNDIICYLYQLIQGNILLRNV